MPVSVGLALGALSFWQRSEVWRLAFRIAIVPLLLAWLVLTVAFDDVSTVSSAAEPDGEARDAHGGRRSRCSPAASSTAATSSAKTGSGSAPG